ncbi:MAG: hypothetical protein AAB726_03375 [Patescibacteria group bacterium]
MEQNPGYLLGVFLYQNWESNMATVHIHTCPRCRTLYSNTKGHEFKKVPVPDATPNSQRERVVEELNLQEHKVVLHLHTDEHRQKDCPDCVEYKRELARGGPSRIHQSRYIPDEDANGGWGNVVRALDDY